MEDIGAIDEGRGVHRTQLFGRDLYFSGITPAVPPSATPANVDLVFGLLRHIDIVSLQALDQLYSSFPELANRPTLFLIFRQENEADFKMSCPYCGQKLWVRDADLDKRGRCPNCKKGFTLPNQEAHVAATLNLPSTTPVRRVIHGDTASFSGPLQAMLRQHGDRPPLERAFPELQETANNATMNIRIESEEA